MPLLITYTSGLPENCIESSRVIQIPSNGLLAIANAGRSSASVISLVIGGSHVLFLMHRTRHRRRCCYEREGAAGVYTRRAQKNAVRPRGRRTAFCSRSGEVCLLSRRLSGEVGQHIGLQSVARLGYPVHLDRCPGGESRGEARKTAAGGDVDGTDG